MNSYPVMLTLPAALAGDLLEKQAPESLWLRCETNPSGPSGEVLITIFGPCDTVGNFIAENWGCDYDVETRTLVNLGLYDGIQIPESAEISARICPCCGADVGGNDPHGRHCIFNSRPMPTFPKGV